MNAKTTTFALAASLLFLIPSAAAENPVRASQVIADADSRSGEYIDLSTNVVYHYDATTGVLTPVATGTAAGYVCVDAMRYGQAPSFYCTLGTGNSGTCYYEVCVSAATRLVGATINTVVHVDDYSSWCGYWHESRSLSSSVVQYWDVRINLYGWCGPGTAYARVYVNGAQMAYDSVSY